MQTRQTPNRDRLTKTNMDKDFYSKNINENVRENYIIENKQKIVKDILSDRRS